MRKDELQWTVHLVLKRFTQTFLQIFEDIACSFLAGTGTDAMAQVQVVLLSIRYNLTCQDLPPIFADVQTALIGAEQDMLTKILAWDPENMRGDPDDSRSRHPFLSLQIAGNDQSVDQRCGCTERHTSRYEALLLIINSPSRFSTTEHKVEQLEDDPPEYVRIELSFAASSSSIVWWTTHIDLAASVYLNTLATRLVAGMIALASPADKTLHAGRRRHVFRREARLCRSQAGFH